MLLLNKKGLRNRISSLGGVNFYKSITKSLQIGNYVRCRARKNKQCEVPIKCMESAAVTTPAHTDRADLRPHNENTENFFERRPVPKERQHVAVYGGPQRLDRASVPEHLFGLPFFDEQVVLIAGAEPSRGGDAPRFR